MKRNCDGNNFSPVGGTFFRGMPRVWEATVGVRTKVIRK